MQLAIIFICLAGTASAAPSAFHYLTHYTGPRQQVPPPQVQNPFAAAQPLPLAGMAGAYSVELIYPHSFPGVAGGSNAGQSYHGFIKYSIPQPPGRQSVEVYYPYDFSQQRIITNIPPMTNRPQALPFEYPPQNVPNIPQQTMNIPSFDANPLPSQDPLQSLQQDQPIQASQMPAKV
uniref:Secretory calcium-binding phosphoprotein 5 n=1 Tax=Scophthalmus maximus TaxID=52904 RepID=A0A8D3A8M2_SCOMX